MKLGKKVNMCVEEAVVGNVKVKLGLKVKLGRKVKVGVIMGETYPDAVASAATTNTDRTRSTVTSQYFNPDLRK